MLHYAQFYCGVQMMTSTSLTLVHEEILMVISVKVSPWITLMVFLIRAIHMFATNERGGTQLGDLSVLREAFSVTASVYYFKN